MQTQFSPEQLNDPDTRESEKALRACVHCGFCNSSCPTYTLIGDELDSPRGRIYLMKNMLEEGRPASKTDALHIDRCLSCLACKSTCPSGVNYQHLVDHARVWIEQTYRRPWSERSLRKLLGFVLPRTALFRVALLTASIAKPVSFVFPKRLRAMLRLAKIPAPPSSMGRAQTFPAQGTRRMRVALLAGCVQPALAPEINEATIRILTRHGCEVAIAHTGCCGALNHHLGQSKAAHVHARAQIEAWDAEIKGDGLDAIVSNASGCGVVVKDYGHMFRTDTALAEPARRVSDLACDIGELLEGLSLTAKAPEEFTFAYHPPCSLQHGLKLGELPKALLNRAGFVIREIPESHLCCGSAGTYNLLQPDIAEGLRARKLANIASVTPDAVVTSNIGCMMQIAGEKPVVHMIELLDWATGGPKPKALT